jgi:hypothetical protein
VDSHDAIHNTDHRKVGWQPINLDARLQSVCGEHKECGAEAVELRCLRVRVVAVRDHETRWKAGRQSAQMDIARDWRREAGDCSYLGRRTIPG